ncbi:MAG: hypothetical protein JXM73_09770 [Anaerolineae bacterium]|nr:hypothetical protein [Anaerolineae bacterium]
MQRKRVGERIANGLAGPVLGRTIDVGQTQAVQDVHRIWRELQKLNKREQAGWAALYREVSLAKRDVSGFKRAISEREAVLRQLQAWSSSRGKLQKSMKEVSRVVQRDKRLRDKQNRYGAKVANHYPRIRQEYNNLVHSEERDRHMWERKRKELGNAIRAAESAMAPTFWTKLEALWRKQRLATFERLGQKQRAKIGTWLRTPFDPEPALQRQKAMIQKLAGRTIECSDGRVILDVRT